MKKLFKRMRKDQRGQTATEYMLIIAAIVIVIGGAMSAFGGKVKDQINNKVTPEIMKLLKVG